MERIKAIWPRSTDKGKAVSIGGASRGTIDGLEILSHCATCPAGQSYGIYVDSSEPRADRVFVRNSHIEDPTLPHVLGFGIANYGSGGFLVDVQNVTVIGASTDFLNCNVH
jgi:hypothetical protein